MEISREKLLGMDVIEYAGKVLKLNLSTWQSTYLRNLQANPTAENALNKRGVLYGRRACYLVYEHWKNRISNPHGL